MDIYIMGKGEKSLVLLQQGKKVGAARCEYVFDVQMSKAKD
jgi:hypothetical protein